MESRIRDDNFYIVSGWMVNDLKLKGVPLMVFAIIYGFSQNGEDEFTGSLHYLCDFAGGVSKPTIIKALKELVEKDYVKKTEEFRNGVQFNRYKVNLPVVKNLKRGSKETLPGVVKNFNGGSKETLPNKEYISNSDKDKNNKYIDEFENLWKLYPNKKGKDKALAAFVKARKEGVTYEAIESGVLSYSRECEIKKRDKQYIKHGSTWFNGRGWEDEYETSEQKTGNADFYDPFEL